jgi:hypothetical protein
VFIFVLIDPNTGNKSERLVTINMRSINDCITSYGGNSYQYMFNTYVNEDYTAAIDKITREMLDTKMIPLIAGYQLGPEYVDLQVAALWRVLHDRGFQYSSISSNSGNTYKANESKNALFSQTVRTFNSALKTNQANCVDGTVVFASVLKKIGIRPALITVPGHCFLGYYLTKDENDTAVANMRFLETTMLADHDFISKDSVTKYKKQLIDKYYPVENLKTATDKDKQYFLQFMLTLLEGRYKWMFNNKEYGNQKDAVQVLDVTLLRKKIKPIPVFE